MVCAKVFDFLQGRYNLKVQGYVFLDISSNFHAINELPRASIFIHNRNQNVCVLCVYVRACVCVFLRRRGAKDLP